MAARDGMSDLINQLRSMTEAGTADYSIGAETYWTDDQLQQALDSQRRDVFRQPMDVMTEYASGAPEYHNYYYHQRWVEQAASGSTAWQIEDSAGSAIGTALYTAYYDAAYVRFSADTLGSAYYLSHRQYDLYAVAADVWTRKAAHYAAEFDVVTDNHDLKRSQLRKHAQEMAEFYRRQSAGAATNTGAAKAQVLRRTDSNW